MEAVTSTPVRPSSSTQQLTLASGATYMDLQEATRSENDRPDQSRPNNQQPQSSSQGADYAPLNPKTRSWEVARDHVTIEKIIGKGAFGQVAKGTAAGLPGRPGKTTVAIKMLKCKPFFLLKLFSRDVVETRKVKRIVIFVRKLISFIIYNKPPLSILQAFPFQNELKRNKFPFQNSYLSTLLND